MNTYYVYQYLRDDNTPYYIGKGKDKRAWKSHKRKNGAQLKPRDNSKIKIISQNLTEKEAFDLETKLIQQYKLKSEGGILVNLTYGGEGRTPGKWLRRLISKRLLGKKKSPRTAEHTENQAATMRGKPNPKTALGLKKYYASNPDRSNILKRVSQSVSKWRKANLKKVKELSLKAWKTKYTKKYINYKQVIELIKSNNYNNNQIHNITKFDCITISKLRKKTHSIYKVFPELIY